MTKEQSVFLMNILATLLCFIHTFPFPARFIHTLDGFEDASEYVRTEMNPLLEQSEDTEDFLNILQKKSEKILMEENQKNILESYHLCIWLDQMLTYEDISANKLSLYDLIPLREHACINIDSLNDNYKKTGIWINPKLPVFKTTMTLNDGREQERSSANRDAFTGINGELHKISYSIWNNGYFSCSSSKGCLFIIDLPLNVTYSKDTLSSHQPIQHILS